MLVDIRNFNIVAYATVRYSKIGIKLAMATSESTENVEIYLLNYVIKLACQEHNMDL